MVDSATLSVLVPPAEAPKTPDLRSQIQQILAERGVFRRVTEESLRDEINGSHTIAAETSSVDHGHQHTDEDEESAQQRQEKLWKQRQEMMEQLAYVSTPPFRENR